MQSIRMKYCLYLRKNAQLIDITTEMLRESEMSPQKALKHKTRAGASFDSALLR